VSAERLRQDRIGLIGSHPEAEQHWYDEYTWMKPKYINKERNHDLLRNFVDELMKR
jgi:hypothetical protein